MLSTQVTGRVRFGHRIARTSLARGAGLCQPPVSAAARQHRSRTALGAAPAQRAGAYGAHRGHTRAVDRLQTRATNDEAELQQVRANRLSGVGLVAQGLCACPHECSCAQLMSVCVFFTPTRAWRSERAWLGGT